MNISGFIESLFCAGRRNFTPVPGRRRPGEEGSRVLRSSMLAIPTSSHRIQPTECNPRVFGVLIDWHLDEHMATIVSDLTGFAGFITPSSYEILGGPHHLSGRAAAMNFVKDAEGHYDQAVPSDDHAYPKTGRVRFYLLCFDGLRLIDADATAVAEGADKCSRLWADGQQVLTEIRLLSGCATKGPQ